MKHSFKNSLMITLTLASLIINAMGVTPALAAGTPIVYVTDLQPSWTAVGGGGVWSSYSGPADYDYVSPGSTAVYDGREAGIIQAGLTVDPTSGIYEDEGIFGFKPTVTIDEFAAGTLTYDVENQEGTNPVWMTIEIDTEIVDDRNDNVTYQHVPTTNPAGWHTIDAAAGQWQQWNNNEGDVTGNPLISLSDIAAAHTGLNVVRAYLRLGMGDFYHGTGSGTIAWVDQAALGGMIYDFVITVPVPAVSLDYTSWDFGDVEVGGNDGKIFNLTNTGDADLQIGTLEISGIDFSFVEDEDFCSNTTLGQNESCHFWVVFDPSSVGAKTGSVSIPSDASTSPDGVELSGNGVVTAPAVSLDYTSWDFGDLEVGGNVSQSFVLTNDGDADLNVGTLGISGTDFSLGTDDCTDAIVLPSEFCSFEVVFTPASTGAKSGSVSIPSDASTSPDGVELSGNGFIVLPPSVPELISPAHQALVKDYTPLLDWSDSTVSAWTNFDYYQVQLATDVDFNSIVLDEVTAAGDVSDSSFTPAADLDANTRYYWRVRAFDAGGQSSAWSQVHYFRITLAAPGNLSPDGITASSRRPILDWDAVSGAVSYTVQISTSNSFTTLLINTTVTADTFALSVNLPANTTIYWRVRANRSNGGGFWANASFQTPQPRPSVPELISPAHQALVKDYTPILDWGNSTVPADAHFDYYQVQLATDVDFNSIVLDEVTAAGDVSDSSFTPAADLDANTRYYWRVRAFNTAGRSSAWSQVYYFRITLAAPSNLSPTGGETASNRRPILDWDAVSGAVSYTVQVSTSNSFTTLLINTTVTADTFTPSVNLPAATTLYWRVRANRSNGGGFWANDSFQTP